MACNHTNIDCGCKDSFLTSPTPCPIPIDCPESQPCIEAFNAQCVIYSGDPIICAPDVIVATDTNVADALNQVVDYVCNQQPVACCPTFAVDINKIGSKPYILEPTLTNGTPPFTYEWSYAQNDFIGMSFVNSTFALLFLNTVPDNYVVAPAFILNNKVYQTLVRVKVTDSVGQIATAYYKALQKIGLV